MTDCCEEVDMMLNLFFKFLEKKMPEANVQDSNSWEKIDKFKQSLPGLLQNECDLSSEEMGKMNFFSGQSLITPEKKKEENDPSVNETATPVTLKKHDSIVQSNDTPKSNTQQKPDSTAQNIVSSSPDTLKKIPIESNSSTLKKEPKDTNPSTLKKQVSATPTIESVDIQVNVINEEDSIQNTNLENPIFERFQKILDLSSYKKSFLQNFKKCQNEDFNISNTRKSSINSNSSIYNNKNYSSVFTGSYGSRYNQSSNQGITNNKEFDENSIIMKKRRNWLREYSDLSKDFSITKFDYLIMSFAQLNDDFPNFDEKARQNHKEFLPQELIAQHYLSNFIKESYRDNELYKNLNYFIQFAYIFCEKKLSLEEKACFLNTIKEFIEKLKDGENQLINKAINTYLFLNKTFVRVFQEIIDQIVKEIVKSVDMSKIPQKPAHSSFQFDKENITIKFSHEKFNCMINLNNDTCTELNQILLIFSNQFMLPSKFYFYKRSSGKLHTVQHNSLLVDEVTDSYRSSLKGYKSYMYNNNYTANGAINMRILFLEEPEPKFSVYALLTDRYDIIQYRKSEKAVPMLFKNPDSLRSNTKDLIFDNSCLKAFNTIIEDEFGTEENYCTKDEENYGTKEEDQVFVSNVLDKYYLNSEVTNQMVKTQLNSKNQTSATRNVINNLSTNSQSPQKITRAKENVLMKNIHMSLPNFSDYKSKASNFASPKEDKNIDITKYNLNEDNRKTYQIFRVRSNNVSIGNVNEVANEIKLINTDRTNDVDIGRDYFSNTIAQDKDLNYKSDQMFTLNNKYSSNIVSNVKSTNEENEPKTYNRSRQYYRNSVSKDYNENKKKEGLAADIYTSLNKHYTRQTRDSYANRSRDFNESNDKVQKDQDKKDNASKNYISANYNSKDYAPTITDKLIPGYPTTSASNSYRYGSSILREKDKFSLKYKESKNLTKKISFDKNNHSAFTDNKKDDSKKEVETSNLRSELNNTLYNNSYQHKSLKSDLAYFSNRNYTTDERNIYVEPVKEVSTEQNSPNKSVDNKKYLSNRNKYISQYESHKDTEYGNKTSRDEKFYMADKYKSARADSKDANTKNEEKDANSFTLNVSKIGYKTSNVPYNLGSYIKKSDNKTDSVSYSINNENNYGADSIRTKTHYSPVKGSLRRQDIYRKYNLNKQS